MRVAHPQRGLDAAEVRELVEAHYDDVFAYCRRRMWSADEAEDVAQETFLRFVRTAGRYRDAGRPLAYLLTIARNACVDAGRARLREPVELPDDDVLDASAFQGGAALDREEGGHSDRDALARALASLPPDMQEVLELRFDQELRMTEIARVMGISRFAAKRRLDGALVALRREMQS